MPVPVRDRSTSRRMSSSRPRTSFRQMFSWQRQLWFPRRPPSGLPVLRTPTSGLGSGTRLSAADGHRGASSERRLCRHRRPNGRSRGNPSPRRPIRHPRMCAGRRARNHDVIRCPVRLVCSSLLRRPLRLPKPHWRRQRAACGLRGECAERQGAVAERAAIGPAIPPRGCCRRACSPTSRRMGESLSERSGRHVGRESARRFGRNAGRSSCGTRGDSLPRWAAAASHRAGRPAPEESTGENSSAVSSTAVSSHCHWRRCRRGSEGERRRGADDLSSGNRGRSHAVRACQGETLASCLLLKNCLLVQYGSLAVLVSGAGHTAAIGFPTGVPAGK